MTPKDAKVIEIQKLAYQIYLQRCRDGHSGSAEDDWLQACELINKQNSPVGHKQQAPAERSAGIRLSESGKTPVARPLPAERRGSGR